MITHIYLPYMYIYLYMLAYDLYVLDLIIPKPSDHLPLRMIQK